MGANYWFVVFAICRISKMLSIYKKKIYLLYSDFFYKLNICIENNVRLGFYIFKKMRFRIFMVKFK